jgi:hypothetical protein
MCPFGTRLTVLRSKDAVPTAPGGFLTRHPWKGAVWEPGVRSRELADFKKIARQGRIVTLY